MKQRISQVFPRFMFQDMVHNTWITETSEKQFSKWTQTSPTFVWFSSNKQPIPSHKILAAYHFREPVTGIVTSPSSKSQPHIVCSEIYTALNLRPPDLPRSTGSRCATNFSSNLYHAATKCHWRLQNLDLDDMIGSHESKIQRCDVSAWSSTPNIILEARTRCAESATCNNLFFHRSSPVIASYW